MEPFVYETEKAIVRIHTGKRTEEERRVALENAAKRFFKEIQKEKAKKGQTGHIGCLDHHGSNNIGTCGA